MLKRRAPSEDVAEHEGPAVIALVDYGAGNLTSVRKALGAIGASVWTPTVAGELGRAHGIIVPGVGHFDATKALTAEWRTAIKTMVDDGMPLLGICVGLQWLFEGSEEAPDTNGLSMFKGTCHIFSDCVNGRLKVPHVGWNSLVINRPSRLMTGVKSGAQVYFTHSYAAPITRVAAATTEHGARFASVVEHERIFGVQFHPEKSSDAGLRVLRSFVEISKSPNFQISR